MRSSMAATSRALSIEIVVHLTLLCGVVLPLATFAYPYFIFEMGAGLINRNLHEDWAKHTSQPAAKSGDNPGFLTESQENLTAVVLTLVTLGTVWNTYLQKRKNAFQETDRRFRPLVGSRGEVLRQQVESLWTQEAEQTTRPPAVMWFANSSVYACATLRQDQPLIAVSIGLWERFTGVDQLCKLILLHELAHLAYSDPITLARFNSGLEAIRKGWTILVRVLWGTLIFMMAQCAFTSWRDHSGILAGIGLQLMIVLIGLIVMMVGPIVVGILRRYFGMITSLIELRADVRAAQWAGSLESFVKATQEEPLVHRSDYRDRARSLFSLGLTHLSETERTELLAQPDALILPKFKYFIFSLILALLMTANIYTSMLEGGIFNLLILEAVAVAALCATTFMLINAGGTTWKVREWSFLKLAAAVVVCTASCHLWFDTITYSCSARLLLYQWS